MSRRKHPNESPIGSRPSSEDMQGKTAHDRAEVAAWKRKHRKKKKRRRVTKHPNRRR